ncbi:alpha/beta hydrolase [Collibacillus ludicampi]|uniref:Alpha/beta hydrolase n=1 Tax=Collibacillus ludicampi TaxID=2771369 RepID=A0AAV4LIT4_9BACL|nr:alpha/beta fold hydrolase [Collibacillus ludicampi]GIM47334.1 alpha/beta hydrolase [Collibacillus ludicampi]
MKKFLINSRGQRIHLIENTFGKDSLFILCHGFTGSSDSHVIASLRDVLTQNRMDNVSVDFTNNLNESEGEFENHTISLEIEDLRDVYTHYRDTYDHIYLLGHSMGCTVVTQFAIETPIDGIILAAPAYNIAEVIISFAEEDVDTAVAKWREQGTVPIYKEAHDRYYPLRFSFYEDAIAIPYERVREIVCPCLVIYSDADTVVPPEQSQALYDRIGSSDKEIVNISGADHSFESPSFTKQLQAIVMRWINKQTAGSR